MRIIFRCRDVSLVACLWSLRRIGATALGAAALLLGSACGNKEKRADDCAPAIKRTQQYFGALCKAWRSAPRGKGQELAQVTLAEVDLPLVTSLPDAPLAILWPGRLMLGQLDVPRWSTFWRGPSPPQSAYNPATRNAALIVGALQKIGAAKGKRELLLAIDARTPAQQVVFFLDLARRAGTKQVSFLLTPKTHPRIPGGPLREDPTAMARRTPKPGRSWAPPSVTNVERVAGPWRDKRCSGVTKLLRSLLQAGSVTDCHHLATSVRQAITRCGCAVDERPLLSLVRGWIKPIVFTAIHRVTLSLQAQAPANGVQAIDVSQPWSKVLARVLRMDADAFTLAGFVPQHALGPGVAHHRRKNQRVSMSHASVTGGLDSATVRRVVRRHLSDIAHCYVSLGAKVSPALSSTITADWTIGPSGAVGSVTISHTTMNNKPVEGCIQTAIRRWRFPKPAGAIARVRYPFYFKPPG